MGGDIAPTIACCKKVGHAVDAMDTQRARKELNRQDAKAPRLCANRQAPHLPRQRIWRTKARRSRRGWGSREKHLSVEAVWDSRGAAGIAEDSIAIARSEQVQGMMIFTPRPPRAAKVLCF